jgi:excisionase family DNA binding protein
MRGLPRTSTVRLISLTDAVWVQFYQTQSPTNLCIVSPTGFSGTGSGSADLPSVTCELLHQDSFGRRCMPSKLFPRRREPPMASVVSASDEQEGHLGPVLQQIRDELREIRDMLAGAHKELYTVDEIAELTGRTPYTVRRWVAEGRIRATRVQGTGPRGRLLIARDQLQQLIGSGRGGTVPADVGAETQPAPS